jgi:membrane fusion protein (multidrug efflux system)
MKIEGVCSCLLMARVGARTGMVILAASGMAHSGCGRAAVEELETSAAVPVVVQAAVVKTIRGSIVATGVIAPAPGADLIVTAPEAARIAEMPRAEGDRVREGDLLVRFDIPTMRAALTRSQAEVTQAEARVELARASAERLSGLFERGVAARKDVEDARRELADAQAALTQAQSATATASSLATRTAVRAPFAGVVARRWRNPGAMVEPGAGDPILRVIDPKRLEAVAAIALADLPRIATGHPARVVAPGADAQDAQVASLPAAVEPSSATANVRLSFAHLTRLTAGTPVQVEIYTDEHPDVVVVPAAAIVREGDQTLVIVAGDDGKAHRKPVTPGLASGSEIEIRSGVTPGDQVIVKGQDALPDDAAITISK